MKKILLLLICFIGLIDIARAADLMQIYQEALTSDPIYQQAIAKHFSDQEGVPITVSALLPAASITGGPTVNGTHVTGNSALSTTSRGYAFTLNVSQTIFDFGKFASVA